MEKEMMEKVNEILKANGRRELSMDEVENVVGGSFSYDRATGMCTINGGTPVTAREFSNFIYTLASTYDSSVAIDTLAEITGFWDQEMAKPKVLSGQEAIDYMEIIMAHFWSVWDGGHKH